MTVETYAEGQFSDVESDEEPLGDEEKQVYLMELIHTSLSSKLGRARAVDSVDLEGMI